MLDNAVNLGAINQNFFLPLIKLDISAFIKYLIVDTQKNPHIINSYLECGQAIESCSVHSFRGDIGDICYKILKISAGLFQVGGVNDDLHQLQQKKTQLM